jgi:REP element-mobilizing transposase RayT
MPKGLRRIHGGGNWHFITCSCYRRQQLFSSARRKDLFLRILEEVRAKHNFVVGGYVVMPEHFHLLISEPARGTLSLTMQVPESVAGVSEEAAVTTADESLDDRSAVSILAATVLRLQRLSPTQVH